MLTGRPPFSGASSTLVFARHQSELPASPRIALPDLAESVERVLLRALEKCPEDRYASGTEFAVELQVALAMPMGDFPGLSIEPRTTPAPGVRAATINKSQSAPSITLRYWPLRQ